jgi:hypothetical protein
VTVLALVALLLLPDPGEQRAAGPAPAIVTSPGRYGTYYHLRFVLSADSVDLEKSDRRVRDGGQFDIRLRANQFPVPAPACRGGLILRMPWTADSVQGAADKIKAKEALLTRIRQLDSDRSAMIPVVVELNPYVRVVSRSPLRVALTGCNVYFRHASGAYVDHLEPSAPAR